MDTKIVHLLKCLTLVFTFCYQEPRIIEYGNAEWNDRRHSDDRIRRFWVFLYEYKDEKSGCIEPQNVIKDVNTARRSNKNRIEGEYEQP